MVRADFEAPATAFLQPGVSLSMLLCRHASAVLALRPGQRCGVSVLQASATLLSAAAQSGAGGAGAGVCAWTQAAATTRPAINSGFLRFIRPPGPLSVGTTRRPLILRNVLKELTN